MKTCSSCLFVKPYSDFYYNYQLDIRRSVCKKCMNDYSKERNRSLKAKTKYLRMSVRAVEMFMSANGAISLNEIASKIGSSPQFVSKSLLKYTEKPKQNLTLKSKV